MNGWATTRVWIVNDKLVVANSIESAISLYKKYYDNSYTNAVSPDITKIEAVSNGSTLKSYDAIIKEE